MQRAKTFSDHIDSLIEQHPNYTHTLRNLKYDAEYLNKRNQLFFTVSLTAVWGAIALKTSHSGPFPIFAKRGLLFGTGRLFRHYTYSLFILGGYFYGEQNRRCNKTLQQVYDYLHKEAKESDFRIRLNKPYKYNGPYYNNSDTTYDQ